MDQGQGPLATRPLADQVRLPAPLGVRAAVVSGFAVGVHQSSNGSSDSKTRRSSRRWSGSDRPEPRRSRRPPPSSGRPWPGRSNDPHRDDDDQEHHRQCPLKPGEEIVEPPGDGAGRRLLAQRDRLDIGWPWSGSLRGVARLRAGHGGRQDRVDIDHLPASTSDRHGDRVGEWEVGAVRIGATVTCSRAVVPSRVPARSGRGGCPRARAGRSARPAGTAGSKRRC